MDFDLGRHPRRRLTAIVVALLAVAGAAAQPQRPRIPPTGTIKKVRDNLYVIPGAGGNTTVFVTQGGVVLVDTKLPNNGEAILNQVRTVTELAGTTLVLAQGSAARPMTPAQPGGQTPSKAQQAAPPRATPPTRDPNTPGYVTAKELPDGAVPPVDAEGNFIIGPTHNPAPDMIANEATPHGAIYNF